MSATTRFPFAEGDLFEVTDVEEFEDGTVRVTLYDRTQGRFSVSGFVAAAGATWLVPEEYEPCGAQAWAYDDDGGVLVYGTCGRPRGHLGRWHSEWRDDVLWAEWSGAADARAPVR